MHPLIQLLRPHQWIKNGFVFAGLLFSHSWHDAALVQQALQAFVAFCLISSAVYAVNDLLDREQDRRHPVKSKRPLASGTVGVPAALLLAGLCLLLGLGLVLGALAPLGLPASQSAWVYLLYFGLNIAYSLGLKHVVVLDVFIIAAGFMLRLLAGTLGLGIVPSYWMLLCGLMLTLFLGFAKRRAELNTLLEASGDHRRVLDQYSVPLLDQFLSLTAMGAVVTYGLYTVSEETVALHGTTHLMATVPVVLYGVLRYLYRLQRQGGGGDPARELLNDPHLLWVFFIWLALVIGLLA